MPTHTLRIDCADRPGLVYAVTGVLYEGGYNVVANHEFVDHPRGHFFMRTEFTGEARPDDLVARLRERLPEGATIRLIGPEPPRLVVLATREYHCLAELLVRQLHGDLNAEIVAVLSNHATLGSLTEQFGVPFHHVPHEGLGREEHERALLGLIADYAPDYLVLAKYMRVLTPDFVARYPERIVNIHHSFLPAFIGASPYRQAFERGVKIIGATAHFVTDELDEGPIIAQSVIDVDHRQTAEAMAQAGRDVEKLVLARALQLVCEGRVFLSGKRTIIFD